MLQSVLDRNSNTKKSHELWTSRCNLFKYCAENVSYLLGNSYEVAVSLKRAANHCTFLQVHILLWFISLQLCTENTAGRSSLMFGTYRQLSSQCYAHLIRQGYVVRWGGSACHSYQPKMSSQTSISS